MRFCFTSPPNDDGNEDGELIMLEERIISQTCPALAQTWKNADPRFGKAEDHTTRLECYGSSYPTALLPGQDAWENRPDGLHSCFVPKNTTNDKALLLELEQQQVDVLVKPMFQDLDPLWRDKVHFGKLGDIPKCRACGIEVSMYGF